MKETELQTRLRRATEHLAYCREQEAKAGAALQTARQDVTRARERQSELFAMEERAEVKRRLDNMI